jgi:ribosomal protein S12 methylthiotransferase accessory factor
METTAARDGTLFARPNSHPARPTRPMAEWTCPTLPKYSMVGVERTIRPAETIRRVEPLLGHIGVTRVGEVTHLDRNGLPNFVAVRPREAGRGISYYNGKGATRAQAKAGAMMEAVERYSAEECRLPVSEATFERLRMSADAVDPRELMAPRSGGNLIALGLQWVLGYDLIADRPRYVPLNAVVTPYRPSTAPSPWDSSTNGLASGNTREEAVCQALCEVIERDAMAVYCASSRLRGGVNTILESLGVSVGSAESSSYPVIDLDTLPPRPVRLLKRLRRAGLGVYLHDITSDVGVATIHCTVAEPLGGGRHAIHGGYGCHPDARVAVVRALTEAAQSRCACIQGGREDLPSFAGEAPPVLNPEEVFGRGSRRSFDDVPTIEHRWVGDDVAWLLARLRAAGFRQAVMVDLTRHELGVPVVRVVVPLAETWAAFHLHSRRGTLGPRAVRRLTGGADLNE